MILYISPDTMKKNFVFLNMPSIAKENRKLSDVAEVVCANYDDKNSCEGFVNTSIIVRIEQGRVSVI